MSEFAEFVGSGSVVSVHGSYSYVVKNPPSAGIDSIQPYGVCVAVRAAVSGLGLATSGQPVSCDATGGNCAVHGTGSIGGNGLQSDR